MHELYFPSAPTAGLVSTKPYRLPLPERRDAGACPVTKGGIVTEILRRRGEFNHNNRGKGAGRGGVPVRCF